MKFFYSVLAAVVLILVCISLITAPKERLRLESYYKSCKEVGGIVAEWYSGSGPPQTRSISRTCVDPKMILEVK